MSDATLPSTDQSSGSSVARRTGRYAAYVFWLMFLINFLNYLDRWIFTGLSFIVQQDLKIDDFRVGLLNSAFLLVYVVLAMPLGFLADRVSRRSIVAAGVAVWSLATAFTGLVTSYGPLFATRALLGVGEASYYPAGTPMLAAYYPPSRRARILARWGVGSLIGAAAGFLLAAPFAHSGTWRAAFFFTGLPGLVFALLVWRVREKPHHEDDPPKRHIVGVAPSWWARTRAYLRIPTVRVIVVVHAMGFFALTGVTSFLSIYLSDTYGKTVVHRNAYGNVVGTAPGAFPHAGLSPALIPILSGGVVLLGGVLGNLLGGNWSDRLARRFTGARVLTGGLGFLLAMPCVAAATGAPYVLKLFPAYTSASESTQVAVGVGVFTVFALLSAFFINIYNGPVSAALLDVVPADERSAASGTELSLAHLLGDVYAAALIGAIAEGLSHGLGGEQIGLAILLTCPLALLIAGVVGIWGSRFYASDVAALGATPAQVLGTTVAG